MSTADYDRKTLEALYATFKSRNNHDAAYHIADILITPQDPHQWAKLHREEYAHKIRLIKEIRAAFSMSLTEAKEIADEVW